MQSHLITFLFEQAQEKNEDTSTEQQDTQPEKANKQEEDVLPIVDSAATGEQAQKCSLNEEPLEEMAAATTTKEVMLHKLLI